MFDALAIASFVLSVAALLRALNRSFSLTLIADFVRPDDWQMPEIGSNEILSGPYQGPSGKNLGATGPHLLGRTT